VFGCVTLRRIVFHYFGFITVPLKLLLRGVVVMFVIHRVFNPFVSSVGSLWAFQFFCASSVETLPLPCTHLLPHYDLVLSVTYLWFRFVALCSRSVRIATTDCKSIIFSHNQNTFSQFLKLICSC
jgi:hypothetical protein